MKKIILASAAAFAFAGPATAQHPAPAGGDITRAAAIADAERRFAELDADGNGTLDATEMRRGFEMRRAAQAQHAGERRRAHSRAGPHRGRGFQRGLATLADFRARAERRFDRHDLDGNGVITRAEQEQLRARRAGARAE